jgi:hypothetical protein
MIAQISRTAPTPTNERGSGRIPTFIYPDVEDRDRCIVFNRVEAAKIDLSIQVRGGSRWFLGRIESQGDGWVVTFVERRPVFGGTIHETAQAAAIAAHEQYREAKRAARMVDIRD